MEKKRFLLAFLLVVIAILAASEVLAGCCQGIIGCSRAFFSSECSDLATFASQECEDIAECNIVACCHSIPGIPKATYQSTCMGMMPPPVFHYIKPFTTNPAAESAYANSLCSGARPPCQYVGCERENTEGCMCGSAVTSSTSTFCCARDNSVFPNFGSCSSSPSCRAGNFYNIHGRVISPEGFPIAGAEIRAGGKQVLTDDAGNFTVELLPDLSSGTAVAIKNSTINSTSYSISGADVFGLDIVLNIVAGPPVGFEICTNGWDDDGDQFGWNSTREGLGDVADRCDPDCASTFGINLRRSVTKTYYVPPDKGEYYIDVSGTRDFCSDRFDNDCDGLEDCEDVRCLGVSPACMETFCGDGTIQFPNADGQYEQCDMDYDTLVGNDSLCPGKCIGAGETRECTCQYEAVCGNGVIDEPLEDCDGSFDAARDRWDSARYNTGSDCTIGLCGKPTSIRPCQCPPPQICGNGIIEEPEQCDLGFLPGATPASGNCGGCNPDCTCPPEAAVCGNNILEYGEDCDGTLTLAGDVWELFKTRKYGCSPDFCAVPKPDVWTPEFYADYLSDLGVDSFCKCPTECKQSPPGPDMKPVKPVRFRREIMINWTDECGNENARAYNVFRCTADGPGGEGCDEPGSVYTTINPVPLGVETSFVDTSFEGSDFEDAKYYCYFVQGVYGDMITRNTPKPRSFNDALDLGKFDPAIHCIRAGMEQCFDFKAYYPWADEFCGDYDFNVRSTCDENNSIIMVDDPGNIVNCREPGEGFEGEYVCVGPYPEDHPSLDGRTQCVPKSLCDYCNDPFGLFGFSSSNSVRWDDLESFPRGEDFGKAPEIEPTEYEKRNRLGYVPCVDLDICYMDYSYTSTNRFYTHVPNQSCYDFHSLKACQEYNDTIGGGVCEWAWHPLYSELGVGVCRTTVVDKQECDRCHDPMNEVFSWCDKESCALYGRCYYDRANLPGEPDKYRELAEMTAENPVKRAQKESDTAFYKCTHERDITCENYDIEEDCIGSMSPYSVAAEENQTSNVVVDVGGNMTSRVFIKEYGSNVITVPSDDFFSFGKCQWVLPRHRNVSYYDDEGSMTDSDISMPYMARCIKNADGSPAYVETKKRTVSTEVTQFRNSDCGGLASDKYPKPTTVPDVFDCRKDFANPVTSIPHYINLTNPMRISGVFEFSAVVHDDSTEYSRQYPDTYACVASEGYYCYPNGSADNLGMDLGNLMTYENVGVNVSYNFSERGFQSGRHVIRYFSEDVSHNLEEVREFPVYIDADAPNIILNFSNVSFEVSEDIWRTNLTLDVSVVQRYPEDDQFAFCNAKMYLGNVSIYSLQDIVNEYNSTWTRVYGSMPDDYYTFWYHCEDDVGNVAEANVTFLVDGDKSITNPQPTGTVNHRDNVISVESGTNAECRYLRSVEDNPAFWPNVTFDEAIFNTMTAFEVTGSPGSPTTIHRSNVNVEHGFHRYYVKCRMFTDNKLRGNNADQIRFAVDLGPPITTHSTDATPYNSWYNRIISVSLACGDPPILGQGLDWSLGCSKSYYCIGLDCVDVEGEFRNYSVPIPVTSTTYISYYSVDKGGNKESPVENVLFQLDLVPPDITVEFFYGDSPVDVLVMNKVYKIRVSSSKPFISPAVSRPTLTYASQPSKFAGDIELLPTLDPSVWEGLFFLENINANRGFEGEGVFTASGTDYHNVSGSGSTTIRVDTKPPDAPVLEPSLEDPSPDASEYQDMGYPVHHYNGTYYTNKGSLFVTGYTNEYLDMIAVTSVDDVDSELIFTQTPTRVAYNDTILSAFAGAHEIKIFGDITLRVNNSLYVGFDNEERTIGPKTVYGAYGMFYDVTNLIYHGGDEQYTSVIVYPGLEDSSKVDRKIFFYDKESPSYWFGFDLPLAAFRNTTFYLKSYDDAENIVRYPAISEIPPYITFFSDPVAPAVMSHFPRAGSTSRTTMDIEINVREGRQESGLYEEVISFTINGELVSYIIEHNEALEEADPANQYYRIYYPVDRIDDGVYDVAIEGADLAMNSFSEADASSHWTFEVDRRWPADPGFSLVGGFKGEGEDRWYSRTSPDFIIDFSAESNPVTVVDVMMEDAPTEGSAATCTETGNDSNIFRCVFTTPKLSVGAFWADYGVLIKAFKTLDDGTDSPVGTWGPFLFTVDDQPPEFVPIMQTRFMDNINLTVGAIVSNENHRLHADLEIFGEHYAPLYSSNNGSFYYFVWAVPDYTKDQEGETSIKITLADFAMNSRTVTVPVYVDLTAPRVENISIDITNTVKIGTELFTANPNVTVSGRFIDDDIDKVWIMPGDFNETTGTLEGKKYADIKYDGSRPESFTVSVRLIDPGAGTLARAPVVYNYMLINQINNMTLYVRDKAGHVSYRSMRVISDIAPPIEPVFCLGEEWFNCMPPMPLP